MTIINKDTNKVVPDDELEEIARDLIFESDQVEEIVRDYIGDYGAESIILELCEYGDTEYVKYREKIIKQYSYDSINLFGELVTTTTTVKDVFNPQTEKYERKTEVIDTYPEEADPKIIKLGKLAH